MSDKNFVAIGDIHGCNRSMHALLDKLKHYADRQFVFVGDYIDRGPDSKAVVDSLLEFQQNYDCVFLRGNHEQMLLDAYLEEDTSLWMMNGGRATLESYGTSTRELEIPDQHLAFYRSTEMYYDTGDYFFVHAGLSPVQTIADSVDKESAVEEFLWERSHIDAFETPWEKTVVFGHTPRPQPLIKERMIGIDTGCVFNKKGYGTLTAVLLPEEEFIQQKCID